MMMLIQADKSETRNVITMWKQGSLKTEALNLAGRRIDVAVLVLVDVHRAQARGPLHFSPHTG